MRASTIGSNGMVDVLITRAPGAAPTHPSKSVCRITFQRPTSSRTIVPTRSAGGRANGRCGRTRMTGRANCGRSARTNLTVTCLGPTNSAFSRLSVTKSHPSGGKGRRPTRRLRRDCGVAISSTSTGGPAGVVVTKELDASAAFCPVWVDSQLMSALESLDVHDLSPADDNAHDVWSAIEKGDVAALQRLVSADYESGRVLDVGGWWVSNTEARIVAAIRAHC